MFTFLLDHIVAVAGVVVVVSLLAVLLLGTRGIAEDESGLMIKRYGPPLASGRIIALNGEAGYQARLLPPGWHVGLWRWRFKIEKVPVPVVQPGEIAPLVAAHRARTPP